MPKVNTNVPAQWHDLVTSVRASTEGPLYTVGQYREEDGKGYRYVKSAQGSGSVAAVAGNLCYMNSATDPWSVTADETDRIAGLNSAAGVYVSVIATGGWGWIQTRGINAAMNCGTPSAGDCQIQSTTDGRTNTVAANTAPTNKIVGWTLVTASANVSTIFLMLD